MSALCVTIGLLTTACGGDTDPETDPGPPVSTVRREPILEFRGTGLMVDFEKSPIECLGQAAQTTHGIPENAPASAGPPHTTDVHPALAQLTDTEHAIRRSWGFEDHSTDELTADAEAAHISWAEWGVRMTSAEIEEMRARGELAEPALELFDQATKLPNFAGFFFDASTGEYVLRSTTVTDEVEQLALILPPSRIRVEQATYTEAELDAVADQIIPIRNDGSLDADAIIEPYRSLLKERRIAVAIRSTTNSIHVAVAPDVSCDIVQMIAQTLGDRGAIFAMGDPNEETNDGALED